MVFDPVPWAINGAATDAKSARVLAYIASRGAQGVVLPGDYKVTALGSPGPAVNIAAGNASILNAQSAGEAYVGLARSTTQVNIAGTTGSPRSDMVIGQIIDPDYSPWQAYSDPNMVLNGPYWQPFVVTGVPSNATTALSAGITYACLPLARIDLPSATSAVTNGMITDLRGLAQPRTFISKQMQPGAFNDPLLVTDTSFRNWPTVSTSVTVPTWATHCMASIRLNQVQVDGFGSDFIGRINMGGITGTGVNFDYNGNAGDPAGFIMALPFEIFADINVTSLQGLTVTVKPEAQRTFTVNTGSVYFTTQQQVIYDLTFVDRLS